MVALDDGRGAEARALLRETMPIYQRLGHPFQLTENLCRAAYALVAAGESVAAVKLIGCCDAIFEQVGASIRWVRKQNTDTLEIARARMSESEFMEAWEQGQALTADEAADLALDFLQ